MLSVLKGVSTLTVIVGSGVNAFGIYPLGPIILTLGAVFWLIASLYMKEPSQVITNLAIILVTMIGLVPKLLILL